MLLSEFKPTYFTVTERDEIVVGTFCVPRLTEEQNVEQLGQDLFALIEHFDKKKVVLDLASVEYMTSSVIGKLITLHRKMHRREGCLVLCELQPEVREVMRLSRLIDYFKLADSVDQALSVVQSA